jgi:hypothetical protein
MHKITTSELYIPIAVEAITTCVGESALQMLKLTSQQNRRFFDNYIVVTTPTDIQTQNYCKYAGLTCVITEAFYKYGFKFNKGAAINEALKHLKYNRWVYHIDVDIYCYDNNYRKILEKELTNAEYFYGSKRYIVNNMVDFQLLLSGRKDQESLVSYPGIYGFSSIWNQCGSVIRNGAIYPEIYEKGESDWRWRNLWGDHAQKDEICLGNLKRLSVGVWHLGLPDISGADSFWK